MVEKVNLKQISSSVAELFSFLKIGQPDCPSLNVLRSENRTWDFYIRENSDEFFYCIEGEVDIEFDDGFTHLCEGDLIIIPKGIRRRPICTGLVKCMLIEVDDTITNENRSGTYAGVY